MQQSQSSDTTNLIILGWLILGAGVLLAIPQVQTLLLGVYLIILGIVALPADLFISGGEVVSSLVGNAMLIISGAGYATYEYVGELLKYIQSVSRSIRFHCTATSLLITLPLALMSVNIALRDYRLARKMRNHRTVHELIYQKKIDPNEKAKNILVAYNLLSAEEAERLETFEDIFRAFAKIRESVAIPGNVLARCYPYGSRERLMFLNFGRSNRIIAYEMVDNDKKGNSP